MRQDIDDAKEEIISKLQSGVPQAELCKQFRCRYITLRARLIQWEVDHLKNPARKGRPHYEQRVPVAEYLGTEKLIKSYKLKLKLIEEGYKEEECEICGYREWNNKKIPLELHHINKDRFDNRLENLQILCPNCHAQQPGNSGANIGKY